MALDDRLTPTDVRIGILLARYVNGETFYETGELEAWPSLVRLAEDAGLKKQDTVSLSIQRLRAAGYVERISRGVGAGVSNRYRLIPHEPAPIKKTPGWAGVSKAGKTPDPEGVFEYDLAAPKPPSVSAKTPR